AWRFGRMAVEARRHLHDDERPAFTHQREKWLVEASGLVGAQPDFDRHAVLAEEVESASADERIRIFRGDDRTHDAGVDDPRNAATGASLMTTRLQRAIQRRSSSALARLFERADFGMRSARPFVEALTNDNAVRGHDHRTDQG